jgi:uncharacterized protein (DUF2147 family)
MKQVGAIGLALAFMGICLASTPAWANPERAFGEWYTQSGGARVRVEPCGQSACGYLTWLKEEPAGETWLDTRNKNAALRDRKLRGLLMLDGFRRTPQGWVGGRVYSPENGNTYRAELLPQPDGTMRLKGCLGPICQNQTWRPAR